MWKRKEKRIIPHYLHDRDKYKKQNYIQLSTQNNETVIFKEKKISSF